MKIIETNIKGVFEIENSIFKDQRGLLVKTFHKDNFKQKGLVSNFEESFYSVSKKNVIRGMHYQKPPHDHAKLVYVIDGEIIDVALDIRKFSPTKGKYYHTKLSSINNKSIYMDKGIAHGFMSISQSATVVYLTSTVHSKDFEDGYKWDSFGYDWDEIKDPILSERDKSFKSFIRS